MKIRNWEKFQHFKDRNPPWIKLYRGLLDDPDWHQLDPQSAKILVMLWLIASENHGELPESKRLSFRLRISEKDLQKSLERLQAWLYQDDIKMISTRYQVDIPETETETERETERETETEDGKSEIFPCPHDEIVSLYHSMLPELQQMKIWSPQRQSLLRGRWREIVSDLKPGSSGEAVAWFKQFFQTIRQSEFLMGRVQRKDGRPFQADLEWMLKPANFIKIIEGKYHGK